jgi:hypothetical protein
MKEDLGRDYYSAARQCVNEWVAQADGNWHEAELLFRKEVGTLPYDNKFWPYVLAVSLAFREMRPK